MEKLKKCLERHEASDRSIYSILELLFPYVKKTILKDSGDSDADMPRMCSSGSIKTRYQCLIDINKITDHHKITDPHRPHYDYPTPTSTKRNKQLSGSTRHGQFIEKDLAEANELMSDIEKAVKSNESFDATFELVKYYKQVVAGFNHRVRVSKNDKKK